MMESICGCYYHVASTKYHIRIQKHYLPLVSSKVHSTILSTTSRTTLTQKFTNPSHTDTIQEATYTFPLYDGVSVVSFTCRIGKRVLRGLVKEKKKAKEIFDDAVSRGETAGLLEQTEEAADVFSTKLGNIPAGGSVTVEIEYVGELKHHETEGIRFTIPTKIAPRYGAVPFVLGGRAQAQSEGGIKITVDVSMPEGSFIKGVQSPSHPIAVSMGTISVASDADPEMSKASATLSLGSAALEKDFVLIVQSKDVGIPKAILETHPTIRHHRALMATLVPKFSLPPSRPEIVFVADRSGSMQHNMQMLISAMKVFLKSIPVGVKFNICSFGSSHSFLWQKSQSYSEDTLQQATDHLLHFQANFGGTETFSAIKATIENRFKDIPLEIILLTDGDIWQQEELFKYVNEQVEQTNGNIRIFPLGIGNGVSHSLIEGLARAGNGFAQAVQNGERLDNGVVRMLRGALSPHITDYTLEVKYEKENDDFELIDKVTEGLKVLLSEKEKKEEAKPTISLFDAKIDPEKEELKGLQGPTFSLPEIPFPKLHQAPHKIPTLFAFSRTSVYLLMSPETIQRNPTAVILRATSTHGPLELEIPVETLHTPAETIHQLAAKKAVQDLEEGRGWIYEAKDQNGVLVKDRYASSFDELVKKEAVRLGEKFQIAGKWCSFVAVAANDKEIAEKEEGLREQKSLVVDADGDILADTAEVAFPEVSDDDDDGFEMIGGSPNSRIPQPPGTASSNAFGSVHARGSRSQTRSAFSLASAPQQLPTLQAQFAYSAAPMPNMPMISHTFSRFDSSATTRSNEKFGGFGSALAMNQPAAVSSVGPSFANGQPLPPSSVGRPFGNVSGREGRAVFGGAVGGGRAQQEQPLSQPLTQAQQKRKEQNYNAQRSHRPSLHSESSSTSPPPPPPPAPQSLDNAQQGMSRYQYSMTNSVPAGRSADLPQYNSINQHQLIDSLNSIDSGIPYPQSRGGPSPPEINVEMSQPTPMKASRRASSQAQTPPNIGQGNINLFGSIMAGAQGAASLVSETDDTSPKKKMRGFRQRMSSNSIKRKKGASYEGEIEDLCEETIDWSSKSLQEKVARLIELQAFDGSWSGTDSEVLQILGLAVEDAKVDVQVWITLLVVKWFESMAREEEGVWQMVVEKARGWLAGCSAMDVDSLETEAASEIEGLK